MWIICYACFIWLATQAFSLLCLMPFRLHTHSESSGNFQEVEERRSSSASCISNSLLFPSLSTRGIVCLMFISSTLCTSKKSNGWFHTLLLRPIFLPFAFRRVTALNEKSLAGRSSNLLGFLCIADAGETAIFPTAPVFMVGAGATTLDLP